MLTWCALAHDVVSVGASDGDRLWSLSSLSSPLSYLLTPLSSLPDSTAASRSRKVPHW